MFIGFFLALRQSGVPVSLREFLTLQEAMDRGLGDFDLDRFYYLARITLVKDERFLDRFDRIFGQHFKGIEPPPGAPKTSTPIPIPEEWLRRLSEQTLTDDEKAQIEALGGWDKLMETLRQRLEEQKGRHQGGSKWIGTSGTSPFGAYGYHSEGVRIGQGSGREGRAVKVWDKREFRNLADNVELGTRNIKIALRRLRRFAREGAATELDLPGTIGATARNAGSLDLKMVPERHNAVKILLCLDIGGSMDGHIQTCEELFSAARAEFKHLEYYYFHNCPYETLWSDARMRRTDAHSTEEVLRRYDRNWKLVFVGDASMSAYELVQPGGSVSHWNTEAGSVWVKRLTEAFPRSIWLNPIRRETWNYTSSIKILQELMEDRMYPLTLEGLDSGMRKLVR